MEGEWTPRKRVLAALKREPVDRIPYIEHLFDIRVALAIAGGPRRLTDDPELISLLEQAISEAGAFPGWALGLLEPDISRAVGRENITFWGAMAPFEGGRTYLLNPDQAHLGSSADGIIKTREDVERIRFAPIDDVFVERAERFLERKGDFAACAMCWLGLDPVWHSMGFGDFAVAMATDPGLVQYFLDRVTDWCQEAVDLLCRLGFDFIWAADDIAYKTAPFFSPRMYRDYLLPYTRKVAERITLPWIYHSDGNLLPILDDLLSQGMDAIHPLEPGSMDLDFLKKHYGERCSFVGNIDINTLSLGTPEEVRAEVKERIAQLGPGYGYLMSSSNSVTHYCKAENVAEMIQALHEFGAYPLSEEVS